MNLTFTHCIHDEGHIYLYDDNLLTARKIQLEDLEETYNRIVVFLRDNNFPCERDWCLAIAQRGSEGLADIIKAKAEKEADRLQVPSYLTAAFSRAASADVSAEAWKEADELHRDIVKLSDGLVGLEHWSFNLDSPYPDGYIRFFSKEAFDAIYSAARVEVTKEMQEAAESIVKNSKSARKLEQLGVNYIELLAKYCRREDEPGELEIYTDIVTRRHREGDIDALNSQMMTNIAAAKNFPFNP